MRNDDRKIYDDDYVHAHDDARLYVKLNIGIIPHLFYV